MSHHYPLVRLSPAQAGKLQYDFNRIQANHIQLQTELAALEKAMRALYGSQAWLALCNTARNQAKAALLQQEIAA